MIALIGSFFKPSAPFFDLIGYTNICILGAFLSSLSLSLFFGKSFVKAAERLFRSQSRAWTPESHKAKNNTPTMGGVFIIAVVAASCLLWSDLANPFLLIALGCMIGFGLIGGWDDWGKITKKQGITARTKFIAQMVVAALVATSWIYFIAPSTDLSFLFFKDIYLTLGMLYIPWAMFVMIGTSNAVNLTDGLDGLATGCLIPVFAFFGTVAFFAGGSSAELAVLSAAVVGALLGFLRYNAHPAQLFMGDVGSLSLGALLAFMALALKQELLLPLVGAIFVAETLSVILQVWSVKYRGKRLFKMAPIHHHYELLGWPETKITFRFSLISFVLSAITLTLLMMS